MVGWGPGRSSELSPSLWSGEGAGEEPHLGGFPPHMGREHNPRFIILAGKTEEKKMVAPGLPSTTSKWSGTQSWF